MSTKNRRKNGLWVLFLGFGAIFLGVGLPGFNYNIPISLKINGVDFNASLGINNGPHIWGINLLIGLILIIIGTLVIWL
jgi:hypothetical protein